jgi:hypothetical protein
LPKIVVIPCSRKSSNATSLTLAIGGEPNRRPPAGQSRLRPA